MQSNLRIDVVPISAKDADLYSDFEEEVIQNIEVHREIGLTIVRTESQKR